MNLNRIKEFFHIAKAGSFTKAAEDLNISQPALSRSMQLFEHHLGCKLFVRYARGVKLTPEGEKVYEFACRVMEEASLLGKSIKTNGLEGDLTVALPSYLSGAWLIKRLKSYLSAHTDIRMKILEQIDNLRPGEVDVMIGFEAPCASDAIKHVLLKSNMALFASKAYLEKFGAPQDLEDLNCHQLISYSEHHKLPYKGKEPWLLKVGEGYIAQRLPHLRLASLEAMLSAACDGLGIAELPQDLAEVKDKGLVPIWPHLSGPEIELSFIYPQELKGRATIRSLKDYLAEDFEVIPLSKAC